MSELTPDLVRRLEAQQEILDLPVDDEHIEAIREGLNDMVLHYKEVEAANLCNEGIAAQVEYLWAEPVTRTVYASVVAGPDQVIWIQRDSGDEFYFADLFDGDGNHVQTLGRFRDLSAAYAFVPVMLDVAAQERRALLATFDDEARKELKDDDLKNLHAAGARVGEGVR